jgi:hypothetical protein
VIGVVIGVVISAVIGVVITTVVATVVVMTTLLVDEEAGGRAAVAPPLWAHAARTHVPASSIKVVR